MKAGILTIIFFLCAFSTLGQTSEAQMIDKFGRVSCGDFMARMDGVFHTLKKNPDSKIHVVFYGARYRRHNGREAKNRDKLFLSYPHRDDGLNYAKAIPFYFANEPELPAEIRDFMKDRIVLAEGGFREEAELELWLVPQGGETPVPTPTVAEKDIKFRKDNPLRIPRYTCCYCAYK